MVGRAKLDDGLAIGSAAVIAASHGPSTRQCEAVGDESAIHRLQGITWREAGERKLQSRFAAVRIRAAHRDYEKAEPHQEEWLLIEWPRGEKEPTKYWLSTLPPTTKLKALIKMAKHRWIIERVHRDSQPAPRFPLGHSQQGR